MPHDRNKRHTRNRIPIHHIHNTEKEKMIKTFTHGMNSIVKGNRDTEINQFLIENEVFATQTNTLGDQLITTLFYKSRSKWNKHNNKEKICYTTIIKHTYKQYMTV